MKCNAYTENRCKSCQYLDGSYAESLLKKEEHFFAHFNRQHILKMLPTVGVNDPAGSRNKAKLAVTLVNEEIVFGITDGQMNFKNLEDCPLHLPGINELLGTIKTLLTEFKIIPYDLKSKTGELKFVLITKSDTTNQYMVRFVVRSKESIDRLRKLTHKWQMSDNTIALVSANIQPEHKAILEGEEEIIFTDKKYISHFYHEFELHLGVKSFFQVTSEIARKLYSSVGNFFRQNTVGSVLDLYCGVGAFSFYSSPFVRTVLGVEISTDAIDFANQIKNVNQVPHVEFKSLDVDYFLEQNKNNFDAIIVNPPRRGIGEKSVKRLLAMNAKFIVYSSCNAQSLAVDWQHLQTKYKITSAQIFDMFPYSAHYEVLLILQKI